MKNILIAITLIIQSIPAIGQDYTIAEYSRIECANLLTEMFQEGGYKTKVEAIGPDYSMLAFSGGSLFSEKGLKDFIQSAGMETFEPFYDDYGFMFICFSDWGLCYVKSELENVVQRLNNPEGKRITKFNYR